MISIWQPNELDTRDTEKSKAFSTQLFGWDTDTMPMGDGQEYTIWTLDGHGVGGMLPMPDMVPDEVPNMEGVGRFAVVADPHGAAFSVIKLAEGRVA
ncbi:MAG: hypothetical protein ACRDY6_12895 [Acidimicrobiia bacterium]